MANPFPAPPVRSPTVAVSSNVGFSDELGSTEAAVEDLGSGLERVALRSNAPSNAHPAQFFRVTVQLP